MFLGLTANRTQRTHRAQEGVSIAVARLRNQQGFMLAEQLVSVVFIGLLCIVVAAGLGAAMTAYGNITKQTRADSMLSDTVELVSDQLGFAQGAVSADGVSATFVSATTHTQVQLLSTEAGIILRNIEDGVETILVPIRSGMRPAISVLLAADQKSWSITVEIHSENAAEGTNSLAEVQNLTVQRIGS